MTNGSGKFIDDDHLEALRARAVTLRSKTTQELWERLRERKAQELGACSTEGDVELEAVSALAERFQRAAQGPQSLLNSIAETAVALLGQGRLTDIDAVQELLVGNGPPDQAGKRPTMKVQLAFDLGDPEEFQYGVYSPSVRQAVIEVLPRELSTRA